ncbi:MAG: DNA polymerase III subunit gamma/tau [Burkholderiaceae bacterium]
MSYLVLARKYRPRTFTEMVGQEHVVQALGNALQQQRLHHAYLFTGTRGVGKTTVSRILAKSLNCQGPDGQGGITAEPCRVCDACTQIDAGRFVDYTELDAASNRGVGEIQELLEQAVYKPVQGRFKVFMIDEVHMLSGHAFNAMLKTLEEPPDYLKFVLATTDPQKVPVTVLSRCLQFNLRPMAPETVHAHLTNVLASESVPADAGSLQLIARAARGSLRDALSLTDQAIAFGGGQLQEAAVRRMLGSADRSIVFALIDALARSDGAAVVQACDALREQGLNAAATLEDISAVLQRMAVCQAVPASAQANSATANAIDPDAAEVTRLAALMPPDETQLLYSICLHGRAEIGLAPDEYAGLVMVLLRLLAFKPAQAGTATSAHGVSAEKKSLTPAEAVKQAAPEPAPASVPASALAPAASVKPAPQAPAAPQASPTPSSSTPRPSRVLPVVDAPPRSAAPERTPGATSAPVMGVPVRVQTEGPRDQPIEPGNGHAHSQPYAYPHSQPHAHAIHPTPEGDFWAATVRQLVASEAVTALVRELALQSQLVGRDEHDWLLRVERESLNQGNNRDRLQAALKAAGHDVTITVEICPVSDSPARRIAAANAERQRAAEHIILDDPFVQAMMRDYGATIVPGSIKPVATRAAGAPVSNPSKD